MKLRAIFCPLLGVSLSLFAAGCATNIVPQCPSVAALSDTATMTVMRPGAPADPSGEAYTAMIGKITASCRSDKGSGTVDSMPTFTIRAVRAPSPDEATIRLPYFIAVTQGDRVLAKQNLSITLTFPAGSASVSQDISPDYVNVSLEPGHPATDYQLLFGFPLTDAQRAYNQKFGRYLP